MGKEINNKDISKFSHLIKSTKKGEPKIWDAKKKINDDPKKTSKKIN